ncbi:MAG: tetratricopeptide repeat protein [Candidatus Margulisiibacteriota bacterium]|jgi:tetratricopeptide (TPR) repeat protein
MNKKKYHFTNISQIVKNFDTVLDLIKRGWYKEALENLKPIIINNPKKTPDILTFFYKKILLEPNNLELRLLIAELYYFFKDFTNAFLELEEIYYLQPNYSSCFVLFQKIFNNNEYKSEISEICLTAFNQKNFDSSIIDILQKSYLEQNKLDCHIKLYETLIENEPKAGQFYKNLAELYIKNQEYEKAFTTYEQVFELAPDAKLQIALKFEEILTTIPFNYECRKKLIKLYLQICKPEKALIHIKKFLECFPNDTKVAIKLHKDALLLFPDMPEILFNLSKLLSEVNEFTESIAYLQIAFERLNVDPRIIENILQEIIVKEPKQIFAQLLLSDIYFQEKKYELSLAALEPAINIDDDELNLITGKIERVQKDSNDLDYAQFLLAQINFKKKNHKLALSQLEKIINNKNSALNYKSCLLKIKILSESNEINESINFVFDCLKVYTFNQDLHQKLKELQNMLFNKEIKKRLKNLDEFSDKKNKTAFELALIYLRKGDIKNAINYFQMVVTDETLGLYAQVLIGRCFMELNRYDLTINHLSRVLEKIADIDIDFANKIRYLLAMNFLLIGKINKAIFYFDNILEFNINFPNIKKLIKEYKNSFSDALSANLIVGGFTNLEETYITFIIENYDLKDIDSKNNNNLSQFLEINNNGAGEFLKENFKSAETDFANALKKIPESNIIYYNSFYLDLIRKNLTSAQKHLNRLKIIAPKHKTTLFVIGIYHMFNHDYDKAIDYFTKSLHQNNNNPICLINLGDAYYKKGDIKKALSCWESANTTPELFYLIQRRLVYLRKDSFDFKSWLAVYDINKDIIKALK